MAAYILLLSLLKLTQYSLKTDSTVANRKASFKLNASSQLLLKSLV